MKKQVRNAIHQIETDLMYGDPNGLDAVSRADVETLLAWATRKAAATEQLQVGDSVSLKINWPAKDYTFKGAVGYVRNIDGTQFQIDFGAEYPLWFARHELKFVGRKA
jgi:hypothetical protein